VKIKLFVLLLVTAVLTLTTGCINQLQVGPTQTDEETVEAGDIDSARVNIEMGVGELDINGSADGLLDATFIYNVAKWQPEIDYTISGSEGRLTVKQPGGDSGSVGIPDSDDIKYEWDLKLNDDIPMDLDINLGVGESNLELGGLMLNSLDIQTGVGETTIDLTGDWPNSFDVDIEGGVGKTTVRLPDGVGVRVETQTGIGTIDVRGLIVNGDTYTNTAYDSANVILDIKVQGGVGAIDLILAE
jgi:predicted membrane protein